MEGRETAREDLPQEHTLHIGGPMSSALIYPESYINSIVRKFPSSRELDAISLSSDDFRSACEKIKIIEGPFPMAGGKNAASVSEISFWVKYCNDDNQATQDEELVGFYKKQDDGTVIWIKDKDNVLLINRKRLESMKKKKQSLYPIIVVTIFHP